jgi:hypothetical protein
MVNTQNKDDAQNVFLSLKSKAAKVEMRWWVAKDNPK